MAARGKKNTSVADRINSLIFRARADIKDRSLPSRKLFPACMFIATLDRLFLSLVYTFFNTPVCISLPPSSLPPKRKTCINPSESRDLKRRKLRREKKQKKNIYPPLPPKKTSTREKKRNDKNIYVYIHIETQKAETLGAITTTTTTTASTILANTHFPNFPFFYRITFDTKHDIFRLRRRNESERASEPAFGFSTSRYDFPVPFEGRNDRFDRVEREQSTDRLNYKGQDSIYPNLSRDEQFMYNNKSSLILSIFDFLIKRKKKNKWTR